LADRHSREWQCTTVVDGDGDDGKPHSGNVYGTSDDYSDGSAGIAKDGYGDVCRVTTAGTVGVSVYIDVRSDGGRSESRYAKCKRDEFGRRHSEFHGSDRSDVAEHTADERERTADIGRNGHDGKPYRRQLYRAHHNLCRGRSKIPGLHFGYL